MAQASSITEYVNQCLSIIKTQGYTYGISEALYKAGCALLKTDKDYALSVFEYARQCIENVIKKSGYTPMSLNIQLQKMGAESKELNLWYDILKQLAPHKFDAYMLYLERYRDVEDRFYQPRREPLIKTGVVQDLQDLEDDKYDIMSISMPPGTGKAGKMDSKVLTPNGYRLMKDIKVGDLVISGTGNVSKVLGVFPQGKRPIYKITLDDGSCTEVSDNHLWYVQTKDDRRKDRSHHGNKYRIVTTMEMLEKYQNPNQPRYSIDYVPRIEFKEMDFEIHPYVLGVLLGDGCLTNSISITKNDPDLIERINSLIDGYEFVSRSNKTNTYYLRSCHPEWHERELKLRKQLRNLGLLGKKSNTKFIPKCYLYASYEQRLELLRGLLDTDGYAWESGIEYTTVSPQLSEDVRELVHSLGGYCSVTTKEASYKDADGKRIECKQAYRLVIQFSANQPCPMWLPRKAEKYQPRRDECKRYIISIDYTGDFECQCIYIDDPSHLYITDDYIITHNTSLEKFFATWIIGRHPKDFSLFFSHSDDITRMFYDSVLAITNGTDYAWAEIFPNVPLRKTDASRQQIDFGENKTFWSIQCTSRFSKNAGKVRANRYLYCDDIIGGIEEALNLNFLNKLWNVYSVDARQRKLNSQTKELHICTRWSVHDIVGRLKVAFENNPRAKFIAIPDIDPVSGESNFMYEYNPMTVEFFEDQQKLMDDASYRALYKNEPIEREGLLFPDDSLRRYLELPDREPDCVYAQCDPKGKGTDFMAMPVLVQYGDDYYATNVVFNQNTDYEIQYQDCANLLVNNEAQDCEFESNQGGDRVGMEVDKRVQAMGWVCNITTRPTESNKEAKIYQYSNWIKQHILFRDKSMYSPKEDYGLFMANVTGYTTAGKNPHDDGVDVLANFAKRMIKKNYKGATIEAISNPFRYGGISLRDVWGY